MKQSHTVPGKAVTFDSHKRKIQRPLDGSQGISGLRGNRRKKEKKNPEVASGMPVPHPLFQYKAHQGVQRTSKELGVWVAT